MCLVRLCRAGCPTQGGQRPRERGGGPARQVRCERRRCRRRWLRRKMCQLIERGIRRRQQKEMVGHARGRDGAPPHRSADTALPRARGRQREFRGPYTTACRSAACSRPGPCPLPMNVYASLLASPLRHVAQSSSRCLPVTLCIARSTLKPNLHIRSLAIRSRALHSTSTPSAQSHAQSSIVQFLGSRAWRATHRDSPPSSRSRNSWTPPPPQGPWQRFIRWLNSIPSNVILWGVLGVNGVIFVAWQYAKAALVRPMISRVIGRSERVLPL